jgi:primosomal protein N' (replication factor Y) (superfamily II helicase)
MTYAVPDLLKDKILVGQVIEIPVREKREMAVVRSLHSHDPEFPTKKIGKVFPPVLFSEKNFLFLEHLAKEFFAPLPKFVSLFLPKKIISSDFNPPQEKIFVLQDENFLGKGKKQQQAFHFFLENGKTQSEHSLRSVGISLPTLRILKKRGIIAEEWREKHTPIQKIFANIPDISFSIEQKQQIESIRRSKKTILMGSALSYRNLFSYQRILDVLKSGKMVLFVVPDILLLTNISERFVNIFGKESVLAVHAGVSANMRKEIWWNVKKGFSGIVVGTRASLFLPFENLGLILVEEPHENAFKSITPPLYHTANAVQHLSEVFEAPLLFQTSIPDIAFFHTASKEGWQKIVFQNPFAPSSYIIDMRKKNTPSKSILSPPLQVSIRQSIERGKNTLLYINRRGIFPGVICPECGFLPKCPRDNTSLVLHHDGEKNFLLCHTCMHSEYFPERCPKCGKSPLKEFGIGTQKVEMEAHSLFPEANIFRIDRDTAPSLRILKEKVQKFEEGRGNILIGTKSIVRALTPYSVETVGIVLAETDLSFPDFRAPERAFSAFSNIIEKAEQTTDAKIFLQTYIPNNPFFKEVLSANFFDFFQRELSLRKTIFLPPFSEMVKIEYFAKNKVSLLKKGMQEKKKYEELSKTLFPNTHFFCFFSPSHLMRQGQERGVLFLLGENIKKLLSHRPPKSAIIDICPEEFEGSFHFGECDV